MAQRQRGRRKDRGGRAGIALASEDVENDIGGVDAVSDRFGAGDFNRRQPVGEHRDEDVEARRERRVSPGAPCLLKDQLQKL